MVHPGPPLSLGPAVYAKNGDAGLFLPSSDGAGSVPLLGGTVYAECGYVKGPSLLVADD